MFAARLVDFELDRADALVLELADNSLPSAIAFLIVVDDDLEANNAVVDVALNAVAETSFEVARSLADIVELMSCAAAEVELVAALKLLLNPIVVAKLLVPEEPPAVARVSRELSCVVACVVAVALVVLVA